MKADLLITNGNILTLNEFNHIAGSLAVADGRIIGIWESVKPPNGVIETISKTIHLGGSTLIPGFIDTHNHILDYSLNKDKVDCSSPLNQNFRDITMRIREKASAVPKGEWIEGFSYDDTELEENGHPTKHELDQASIDHPIYIKHISNHFAVANSKALELAQINANTFDPDGGYLGREEDGQLDGVLYEFSAMNIVQAKIPLPSTEDMVNALAAGSKDYLAQGITTNTDAGIGLFYDGRREYDAHLIAAASGVNPMRSRLMILHDLLRDGSMFANYTAEQLSEEISDRSNGKARLDSAKLFQDGSIQGYTAALREHYYNRPDTTGELLHNQQSFNEEILDLHKRGFRVAVHGNGDRAIDSILDAYEYALNQAPDIYQSHRIEHVQTATKTDLNRMEQLHVFGSVFINHVYYWGDRHNRLFLGPKRAARINALADMEEHGILTTLHSDCPVTPISPLFSIWAAVNRRTREDNLLGPEQRVDVITALKMMTIYGAEMNFSESDNGSIEIGKQADFAVLDRNPIDVDTLEIKDIEVQSTIIGGKIVYEKGDNHDYD